jgi:hypothetical protein
VEEEMRQARSAKLQRSRPAPLRPVPRNLQVYTGGEEIHCTEGKMKSSSHCTALLLSPIDEQPIVELFTAS